MPEKKLSELTSGLPGLIAPPEKDTLIRGISYDSRRVQPGFLFVALDGLHTDGKHYCPDAVSRGAAALVVEGNLPVSAIPVTHVSNARNALSHISARFYDDPSQDLYVIGVTGTDGKSSTVFMIQQLLEGLGLDSGFLSTVAVQTDKTVDDNPFRQSTPEAPEIQKLLDDMRAHGKQFAVIEATSHGLSRRTGRLADVLFDAACFLNVAHEHLEFHGTVEQYRDDKANLFRALARTAGKKHGLPRAAVINGDDPHARLCIDAARKAGVSPVLFGISAASSHWRAADFKPDQNGTSFVLSVEEREIPVRLSMPGTFNVENFLAAAALVCAVTGRRAEEVTALAAALQPVRGRMEAVDCGQPFRVIVDFAHTPQAFQKLLPACKEETKGKLIVLFGSGGERDTAKRPLQGSVAARYADVVVLSDEDPRNERPEAILEEIAAGCRNKQRGKDLFLISDRHRAIGRALAMAAPGDTVLLLGKGHEKSIIYDNGPIPWNEKATAEKILSEMGYGKMPGQQARL